MVGASGDCHPTERRPVRRISAEHDPPCSDHEVHAE